MFLSHLFHGVCVVGGAQAVKLVIDATSVWRGKGEISCKREFAAKNDAVRLLMTASEHSRSRGCPFIR